MSLKKEEKISKIEIIDGYIIHVKKATVVKENGVEISRGFHRHVLTPFSSDYKVKVVDNKTVPDLDSNNKKQWTHTATDISKEADEVKAIANAVWTESAKKSYKDMTESLG